MATRDDIVRIALTDNGYHDGQGYDERCKYTQHFLGPAYGAYGEGGTGPNDTPVIAYCDIFVSWVYAQAGIPLPNMGSMINQGSQYCPTSWAYADQRGATRNSYEAEPGDQVIFDWTGTGVLGGESHTEIVEKWEGGVLYTVGGNSGPSNVDGFKGTGGVHRHAWTAPQGVGNSLIMGVIDTSQLVTFGTPPTKPIITPTKDWSDMATQQEIEAAFLNVLNKGTGNGQKDWPGTAKATLGDIQRVYNLVVTLTGQVTALQTDVAALKAQEPQV